MAEDEEVSKDAELVRPQDPPPFLEVICKSSGKARRFAAGTEAGFAVSLINRKLEIGTPPALHIEAAKEGEEPISFGPNSVLTDYGNGWRLQTVTEFEGLRKGDKLQPTPMQFPTLKVKISICTSILVLEKCLRALRSLTWHILELI